MINERSLLKYYLLTIITCGIYGIYFMYRYAEDLNIVCAGDGENTTNYIVAILLGMVTCGIYPMIWLYGVGNRLQANAPRYGLSFPESGTTVLLWNVLGSFIVVGPFISMYILIKNMNSLGNAYNAYVSSNYNRY